jgi:hypothetical protein
MRLANICSERHPLSRLLPLKRCISGTELPGKAIDLAFAARIIHRTEA